MKPLDDDWLVAEKWRLSAAGAVARAEVEEGSQTPYKALRVSELFEVREKDQQKRLGYATMQQVGWLDGWMDSDSDEIFENHLKIFCFFWYSRGLQQMMFFLILRLCFFCSSLELKVFNYAKFKPYNLPPLRSITCFSCTSAT